MTLSKQQQKLIKSLHTKKAREKTGLCLVEGEKVVKTAGDSVEYQFSAVDSDDYQNLVTTETPQEIAAVARIPEWKKEDLLQKDVLVVLDGVQDPGNVGTILRLCLGFDAGLLLINCADTTNPKVIRSSVGAFFQVPWMKIKAEEVKEYLSGYKVYRLEKGGQQGVDQGKIALIAGSEAQGISLNISGDVLGIKHEETLESLNVASALAISLHQIYEK